MIRTIIVSILLGTYVAGITDATFDEARSPNGVPSGSNARNGARQPRPTRDPSPDELRIALEGALEPGERVDLVARAVGCTLVLTDRRLLLVRDGANYRPATGIRAWPLDRDLVLRLGRGYRQTNRLTIVLVADKASVFLSAEQLPDAQRLIGEVRQRTFVADEVADGPPRAAD
jgi:hypothetical protein